MTNFLNNVLGDFWKFLYDARVFFAPFFNNNFWWMQIVSIIFCTLFIIGTIYIITKTTYIREKIESYKDIFFHGTLFKTRSLRVWNLIVKKAGTEDPEKWKEAIVEADTVLNSILKMAGYLGSSLDEKLNLLTIAQLSNVEDIKKVHAIREQISKNPDFSITKEEALRILRTYKKSFIELGLLNE